MTHRSSPARRARGASTRAARTLLAAALALGGAASARAAADLAHRIPECRPAAEAVRPTADAELGARARITWYGDSRIASACIDRFDAASGRATWSTLRETVPMLASGDRSYKVRAVLGTALHDLVAGEDGLNRPWPQQLAADHSDLVVIGFGTNDAAAGAQAHRPVSDFRHELAGAVREARRQGKKVLLVEPYRVCDYRIAEEDPAHPVLTDPDALLAPYAAAVAAVGADEHVPVVPLFDLPVRCGPAATSDLPDGLHPTQAFTRTVAAAIARALDAALAAPR